VTVSRYHDGEWNTLNTTVVEETDTELVVNVRTPGFSYFAVSTQSADSDTSTDEQEETSTNDGQQTENETQTGDTEEDGDTQTSPDEGTETTGESGPGFTIISALIAALLLIGWQARK
jgi:cobalamin biosynthesis protein CobT